MQNIENKYGIPTRISHRGDGPILRGGGVPNPRPNQTLHQSPLTPATMTGAQGCANTII